MDPIINIYNNTVDAIQVYAPGILGAIVLIIVAWLVATVLRAITERVLQAAKLDQRFGRDVGDPNTVTPLSKTVGTIVFWLVILLFLPAILDALNLNGILQPVQNMVNTVLNFLPNIIAAGLILVVGWFVASIVKRILTTIFETIGVDRLAARVGLNQSLGNQRLSGVLATIVYFIILIPVLIAALNALQLDAITAPASAMLNNILLAIPNIFAAFLLLAIAYVVAQVISGLVSNILAALGFNNLMGALGLNRGQAALDRATINVPPANPAVSRVENAARSVTSKSPSDLAGYVITVAIMLFAAVEAFRLLGFVALAELTMAFLVLLGQVILGLVIFGIGLWLANAAAGVIEESGMQGANILAPAARVAILVLAGAMALRQMGLAPEIVNLAFGLILGGIAVAIALAFGLGGRGTAAQLLREWRGAVEERARRPQLPDGNQRQPGTRPTPAE